MSTLMLQIRQTESEIRERTDRIICKLQSLLGVCDDCDPEHPCADCKRRPEPEPDPED